MREAINLRQLHYFIAVAEELSFRRAALRLCITQPPLSRQIKALEEQLGAQLFDRSFRQITLTDTGEHFLAQARGLIRHSDRMITQFRSQPEPRSELEIGITTVIDASLFAWVEPESAKHFPNLRLQVKRQISMQSIRDLNAGALDLAIIGLPSRTAGLTVERLLDEPLVVGMSARHPAANRHRLALNDLSRDKLYWFDRKRNPAYYEHCERVFTRLRFKPARMIEPSDYHILLGLVAEGHGVALFPRSLQSIKHSGIVYKELLEGEQLGIGIALAYRADESSETVAKFVKFLKERVAAGS
ncbi:DNA-binding transcriptional LysR family regulator [Chromobacterium alkanivorans]|uniref:LysR family transcriptional regulator n=1 Tax=Chromobacterium alkanivorans TaxID=1071719 RepID=UPI00216A6E4B|nr:LysR family transcriptional regulator [Chromobacterium alkanivorans]MCS3803850.1 DNA-binding transcriptional LysR family regulator [Chromobacterium alkanivorans]MCS3818045.1 DNA-binding transcriptional LysR family regulator [Chromobacterium alkanivorans]MCS3875665.1 DNA-binding transcriptional LysR family regulator [Chromobacterium alkanivorans]